MPRANEYLVEVECPHCGIEFRINKFALKRRQSNLCKSCIRQKEYLDLVGAQIGRITVLGMGSGRPRSDGVISSTFLCRCSCGTEFETFAQSIKSGHTQSCGCYKAEVDNARWQGEDNPQYAGLTEEERLSANKLRGLPEYQQWRESVINRDFGECQVCGSDIYLEVHHIKSFKHNLELALDIDNGITLCSMCHKNYHSFNGGTRKEATKESFDLWMAKQEPMEEVNG